MNTYPNPESTLERIRSRPLRRPRAALRERLFGDTSTPARLAGLSGPVRVQPSIGWAAWLMPLGAAAVALMGWVAAPGLPLRAAGGDTNASLQVGTAFAVAGVVNSVPVARLTSTLSNVAPSTNVPLRGWY